MTIILAGWEGTPVPAFATTAPKWQRARDLAAVLASGPGHPVLVFHRPAAEAVRLALIDGETPSAAVAAWCALARTLLDLCRTHDPRLIPVDLRAAESDPAGFFARVIERTGTTDRPPKKIPAPVPASPTGKEVLLDLLAEATLDSSAEARALATDLGAAGLMGLAPKRVEADLFDRAAAFLGATRQAPLPEPGSTGLEDRLIAGHRALVELQKEMAETRATLLAASALASPAANGTETAHLRQEFGHLSEVRDQISNRLQAAETALAEQSAIAARALARGRSLETRLLFAGARLASLELDRETRDSLRTSGG